MSELLKSGEKDSGAFLVGYGTEFSACLKRDWESMKYDVLLPFRAVL